jgi:thioester reductase-like protein
MVPLRGAEFDVTPVDYVARALVDLSLQPDLIGRTFHLTNPNPLQTRQFAEWMNSQGLGVKAVSYVDWREKLLALAEQNGSNRIRMLVNILAPSDLADGSMTALHPRFDCRHTLQSLAGAGIACPPADPALFATYLRYLQVEGLEPSAVR